MSELNHMQAQILGIVDSYGPIDPPEIGRHLLIDSESARSRCRSLEARGLIDPYYTGGHRGRAYTITRAGQDALARAFPGEAA